MKALHPDFVTQMNGILTDEAEAFFSALESEHATSIRLNPLKKVGEVEGRPIPWSTQGFELSERPLFTADPLFHAGVYYVQESSSMFLEHVWKQLALPDRPIRVLDLCGAPGGKSTQLASLIKSDDLLVANEVIRSRAFILSENVQKFGASNVVVSNNDPSHFSGLGGFFDVILVDAPCSGEGLFRKDSAARDEWSPENVKLCAERQQRILSDVWPSLAEGGYLIYSTCTFNSLENEANVRWLRQEWTAESVAISVPSEWNLSAANERDGWHFYPHKVSGEGLFMTAFRKTAGEIWGLPVGKKKKKKGGGQKGHSNPLKGLFSENEMHFVSRGDMWYGIPASLQEWVSYLSLRLELFQPGVPLGELIKEKLRPAQGLALLPDIPGDFFETIPIDLDIALRFLQKQDVHLGGKHGWQLLNYEGVNLGWLKCLGNRSNNYYPKEWRIRKNFGVVDYTQVVQITR